MYKYKLTEEERQFLQDKIAKLEHENLLGSTLSSQVEANEHVIKQLEMFMNQKIYVGEHYGHLDMVAESIKDSSFRCTPNSMLAE